MVLGDDVGGLLLSLLSNQPEGQQWTFLFLFLVLFKNSQMLQPPMQGEGIGQLGTVKWPKGKNSPKLPPPPQQLPRKAFSWTPAHQVVVGSNGHCHPDLKPFKSRSLSSQHSSCSPLQTAVRI